MSKKNCGKEHEMRASRITKLPMPVIVLNSIAPSAVIIRNIFTRTMCTAQAVRGAVNSDHCSID